MDPYIIQSAHDLEKRIIYVQIKMIVRNVNDYLSLFYS